MKRGAPAAQGAIPSFANSGSYRYRSLNILKGFDVLFSVCDDHVVKKIILIHLGKVKQRRSAPVFLAHSFANDLILYCRRLDLLATSHIVA